VVVEVAALAEFVEIFFYFSYLGTASEDGKKYTFVSNTESLHYYFHWLELNIKTKTG
jgi:hypothetical protein